MKIYQIHETGGEWEDYYDYIVGTYLSKEKAEEKTAELEMKEEEAKRCESCPLNYCIDGCEEDCGYCTGTVRVNNAIAACERCDIEQVKYPGREEYYTCCKNYIPNWDDNTYNIEEVEVIE